MPTYARQWNRIRPGYPAKRRCGGSGSALTRVIVSGHCCLAWCKATWHSHIPTCYLHPSTWPPLVSDFSRPCCFSVSTIGSAFHIEELRFRSSYTRWARSSQTYSGEFRPWLATYERRLLTESRNSPVPSYVFCNRPVPAPALPLSRNRSSSRWISFGEWRAAAPTSSA